VARERSSSATIGFEGLYITDEEIDAISRAPPGSPMDDAAGAWPEPEVQRILEELSAGIAPRRR